MLWSSATASHGPANSEQSQIICGRVLKIWCSYSNDVTCRWSEELPAVCSLYGSGYSWLPYHTCFLSSYDSYFKNIAVKMWDHINGIGKLLINDKLTANYWVTTVKHPIFDPLIPDLSSVLDQWNFGKSYIQWHATFYHRTSDLPVSTRSEVGS